MKVILVNGSPHIHGCTDKALQIVASELNKQNIQTEIFWISNKPIGGCIACKACNKLGKCVFNDVVNEFVDKAKDADGFIFGSPVHYASVAGNMRCFMDRVFYSSSNGNKANYFRFKPAACVISARRAGTTASYDQMNKYFGINQMPVISSRYWNMIHGSEPEQILQDEEGIQVMQMLARNMAYFLKCIEVGKKEGILPPEQEKVKFTNFVK